ncbi:SDR family NAD(P)-dependent oxidoreductase [Actinoallomurus iriomotensis]|uniref:Short-chain dehydrogenase n=1 Tax=Actinoallomurus iriomotensis TaxID=478107 RepID=A0A9W6RFS6_9ACTN|nr:SDR family NAD(P)-dependent oxidoreductase [Actinoallomurus iriomotensis]GLY75101.1 short-chain dehydrogenase [Actinoallomurus iriomotensis]
MTDRVSGVPILLTGASSGIGRALAFALAERGGRLAIAARRRTALDEVADQVESAGGIRPHVIEADLSRPGAAAALAGEATAALGTVRMLVNNAGAGMVAAQAATGDDDRARALFETNLWSPLALTRHLLPSLRAGGGLVVNVTSTLQAVPIPLLGYYGASKAALAHLTRTLRHELAGSGVSVLEIVPGATDTAARDLDLLPWRNGPMRTPPPVSPEAAATAIVKAIERNTRRRVYPATSLLPLEIPAFGRFIARLVTRRVDPLASEQAP